MDSGQLHDLKQYTRDTRLAQWNVSWRSWNRSTFYQLEDNVNLGLSNLPLLIKPSSSPQY